MSENLHAVIRNDVVENVIVCDVDTAKQFDEADVFGPGTSLIDLTGVDPQPGIGWTYQDGTWTAPEQPPAPVPVPDVDSPAEAPTGPQDDQPQDDADAFDVDADDKEA